MVSIPAGPYGMGDTVDYAKDARAHTVSVSAFYMDKNLVTIELWQQVLAYAQSRGYVFYNFYASTLTGTSIKGASFGARHPVQTVSWHDAVKLCNARSEMEGLTPVYYTDAALTAVYRDGKTLTSAGKYIYPVLNIAMMDWAANGYRLPTEAEWEKAARGGAIGLRFPWGKNISQADARYSSPVLGQMYDMSTGPVTGTDKGTYWKTTVPVCSFAANGFGLFDMTGNVREWIGDWYDANYYKVSPSSDPHGPVVAPNNTKRRVLRGGCYASFSAAIRSANRDLYTESMSSTTIGFRTVRKK